MNQVYRKTKIVCTLGPSTDDDGILRQLMLSGMNVARLNFSHGTYESHGNTIRKVRRLREELNLPIAIMLDTKGPEIRLKTFAH
ncbi:MAG: pyruvate kinase, partial [Clostridia bacterium]|nr:pyruvate kinase [Clostridia bacterium]